MYKVDFSKPCHAHFIGIGGVSMSGLAEILKKEGFTVSGSDMKESDTTRSLESNGITFTIVIPEGYLPCDVYPGKYTLKNALGTREITITEKKAGESYTLSGLSAKYDLELRYNAGQGVLLMYPQQIGTSEDGANQYWLTFSDGSSFTWSDKAAVCTEVDDIDKADFTLTFRNAGYYDMAISSFWLAEFKGAPSGDTYIKGGITIPEWQFFEKQAEMSFPITMTKIVEE